jgi:hypothetical protein
MSKKRMPGKRWKGGVTGWEKDMVHGVDRLKKSLAELLDPEYRVAKPAIYDQALAEVRFNLAVLEWWSGNEMTARKLFAEAASDTAMLLERWLPQRTPDHYTSYVAPAQLGAMAASISGQPQLAHKLFAQTELLATGLLSSDDAAPLDHLDALDYANTVRPFVRAYCLIRLGKLSGFHSFIYTVPLERARKATPVWMRTDIHQALDTANLCYELWRSARGGEDYLKKKKFEFLLRALVACLSPGAGEQERLAARQALQAYQDSIHDLYYFFGIYPRVLDLRAAYPSIFG